jgi:site-specific recombinase XerD
VKTPPEQNGAFQKVGPCLYRYRNGTYYARFKSSGKEIRCSLETADRKLAERNLARKKEEQSQIDRSQGKLTLAELCKRYLLIVQRQKPKTVERKTAIIARIAPSAVAQNGDDTAPRTSHWPTGELTQVGKVKPSDCDVWLSRYSFGSASRNLYIGCLKELFSLAVRDRVIVTSPAAHLKSVKREKPIRLTPSLEQFKAIIADVRAQQFNADAQDSADFLEFLGLAGLGQAEVASLTRADVDFEAGRIITFRHKTTTGFAVPLFPQVRPLLERLCEGKAHDERVFKIADAKKALRGACRRLGYPPFSQRSLRRMFIVRAIEKGVDVKVIAEWQGHRDGGKLILDTYSHVNRAHSHRMAQLMSEAEPAK